MLTFAVGHFNRNCTKPPADAEPRGGAYCATAYGNGNVAPEAMGGWGKGEEAVFNPVSTWASKVEPVGDDGW
jgi:hypothetical protein